MAEGLIITLAQNGEDAQFAFPVIQQLRPHLDEEHFPQRVDELMEEGYQLALVFQELKVVAAAGYRYSHSLSWGKFLYVHDLVTDEECRGQGFGSALLSWLKEQARQNDCDGMHLDSGNERIDAHRFYEREGMEDRGKHFSWRVKKI